jgi:zinc protease
MKQFTKIFAVSALALTIQSCGVSTSQKIEKSPSTQNIDQKAKGIDLALEQYQLPNGLKVVLHQDKSDPVVSVAIQYHVGSNREKLGKTGFAHFFEHMLFQNSENVGAGNFIKNIGNMGGILNGGTWQDGTIYYEVVPSDGLEKVLWMESDRMAYFINTVTQAGLENEKQVVKNEKRQSIDNRPYGHTELVTLEALYPEGHPYSWSVIGSLDDLQNATLQDVREFYQQWYGVNNATLVIAGDFENSEARAWVEKYFAELQARGDVTPLPPMPVTIEKSVSLYHEDNFASLPELTLSFPTIEHYQADAYALDLLADLLSDGKDSPFNQAIIEQDKLAPQASALNHSAELAGVFTIKVRAFNNTPLDKVKVSIDNALKSFAENGFTDQQLARIMTRRETDFYSGLTSVFDKAAAIAQHTEFAGDPSLITKEIEQYRNVTRADINRVFNQYINGKNYIATSFVPKGQSKLALTGAVKANVVEEKIIQGAEKTMANQGSDLVEKLTSIAPEKSSFDRSIMPSDGDKVTVTLPKVSQVSLANGIKVLSIEHNELPLVSFSIRVMGGHTLDPDGKDGVANLLTSIMMEGTKNKTPQQLEEALGKLGASLRFIASDEHITLTGSTLSSNFAQVMLLAQEVLLEPRWDESQWDRIKQETLAQIQQTNANPGAIAANVYAKLLYGADSKLATSVTGTADNVNSITLDDVKSYYKRNIVANLATVHVAGNITQAQILATTVSLENTWKTGSVELPKAQTVKQLDAPELYFVDVPGAKQSFIRIGNRAMVANADDFYSTFAVNHKLGGSFSGLLFQILRLEKGYTYGAYSRVSRQNAGGTFTANSSVRSNVTLESLQTFREILGSYGDNFDQAALESTKSVLEKSDARSFETTRDLMGVLQNISSYSLANNYIAQQHKVLKKLTLTDAKQAISTYINPDKMVYLIVGDAKTQLTRLKALGLGAVTLLDRNGNKIKD